MEAPRPLPGSWRHRGARDLARGLRLGALSLALLGLVVVPAGAAAAGPGVLVTGPGGDPHLVSEAELRAGYVHEEFLLRGTPGEPGQLTPRSGVPVLKAIEAVGIPFSTGYLTIQRTNGTVAYLAAEDFEEPSPTFEGGNAALFSVDESSIKFLRPLIVGDPNDVNATDNVATPSGESLAVGVHEGNVLEVGASAAPSAAAAGTPVELTASATGGLPEETFTYEWRFGDGATGSGETVSHAFAGSGTYQARVTATGSDGSGGESAPVAIVVGSPPTTAQPGAATAPTPTKPRPAGPDGKGHERRGGTGAKPAKDRGPERSGGDTGPAGRRHRDRPSHRHVRSRTGSVTEPAPASEEAPTPEAAPRIPEAVPPATTLPLPPPSPTPAGQPPHRAPTPAAARTPARSGETVEGRLVGDDLGAVALEEAAGGPSPDPGSRSAAGAVDDGGVGVPVLALIVVALLAGGALFEWRRSRPLH